MIKLNLVLLRKLRLRVLQHWTLRRAEFLQPCTSRRVEFLQQCLHYIKNLYNRATTRICAKKPFIVIECKNICRI